MKKSAKREKKPATPNPGGKNCVKDFLIFLRKTFTASLWRKGFSRFFEKILYAIFPPPNLELEATLSHHYIGLVMAFSNH